MNAAPAVRPVKPRMGNECNGCGLCCLVEPCGIAVEFLNVTEGPCPALEWEGGRSFCGMVRHPSGYLATALGKAWGDAPPVDDLLGPLIGRTLGVGMGCDAWDESVDGPDDDG